MLGKVTKELLDRGEFPWCLNELFPEKSRYGSPYGAFLTLGRLRTGMQWLGCVLSVLAFSSLCIQRFHGYSAIATTFFSITVGSAALLGIPLIGAFFSSFNAFGILMDFEWHLGSVRELLRPPWPYDSRPLHLMTVSEARKRAHHSLVVEAQGVLLAEREGGTWCEGVERLRRNFKHTVDLYAEYGLIPDRDYKPFFEEAKKLVEAETLAAVPQASS